MNPKIKPCKCGGKAELQRGDDLPYVKCLVCGEEGLSWAYEREAIHSWNGTRFVIKRAKKELTKRLKGGKE